MKQKYYSDKIEESQGDQRKLFKLVKSIMKPEDRVKYLASSSMKNLTNEFNEYFITKIDLIREELDEIEMDTMGIRVFNGLQASQRVFCL